MLGIKERGDGASTIFLPKKFCLIVPKYSIGQPFCALRCIRNFPVAKKFMDKRGGEPKKFLSHSAEYFAGQSFCAVFQKFPVAKKFMDKRKGGSFRRKIFVS